MIREVVLKDFPNWTPEKQLSEYQAYKRLGSYSPFSDADYSLMEMVMNNPNAEVLCKDGICNIKYDDNTFSLDDILEEKYEMSPATNKATINLLRHIYSDVKALKDVNDEMHTLKLILNNIYRMSMTTNDSYAAASEKAIGLLMDLLRTKLTGKKPYLFSTTEVDGEGNDPKKIKDAFYNILDDAEIDMIFKKISNQYLLNFFEKIAKIDSKNLDEQYIKLSNTIKSAESVIKSKIANVNDVKLKQMDGVEPTKVIEVSSDFIEAFKHKVKNLTGRDEVDYNKSKFLFNYLEKHFDELTPEILNQFSSLEMSDENIKKFNSGNFSGVFFNDLFMHEEVRQFGKGELLLEFLFDGVSINGGGESFDLNSTKGSLLGSNQLEVKVYPTPKNIAIGTTGKISRYPIFAEITRLLKLILIILKDPDMLNSLKQNVVKYSDVITDEVTIEAIDEIHSRMERAEVPTKFFEYFDELMPKIKIAFNTLVEKKLDNSNTIKINNKFVTFDDTTNISKGSSLNVISVSSEDNDNVELKDAINNVLTHPYMKENNSMLGNNGKLSEALNEINNKFSKTPMILIVRKSGTEFYVDGIYTEFEFSTVTLGEIKISPK